MVISTPKHWGKPVWQSLHYISFAFPEKPTMAEQAAARNLVYSLGQTMPCNECKKHWNLYIKQKPPQVYNRMAFATWVFDAHNAVNKRVGKTTKSWKYAQRKYDPTMKSHRAFIRATRDIGLVAIFVACIIGGTIWLERRCAQ